MDRERVIETGQMNSRITYLEDEQRKGGIQITKLQQQVEQLWNIFRDVGLRLESTEQFANSAKGQLTRLQSLDESVRQVRERVLAVQEDLANHSQVNERVERAWQGEIDRIKQSLIEHWHRLDLFQRQIDDAIGRVGPLADTQRRQSEVLTHLTQSVAAIEEQSERFTARLELTDQHVKRSEQEISRVERELEPLRRQDEVALTKLQITADQVRRIDDEVNAMTGREQAIQDLAEKIQVLRLDLQRSEQQTVELEIVLGEQTQRIEEHSRQLKLNEERRVTQTDQSERLAVQIREVRSELLDLVLDWQHLLEQQKMRELTEVERQVKEMKERIVRLRTGIPASLPE